MLLVDKVSGTSANIFLNPTENEFISPLDFHPDSSKYAIHVYGLVTRETENGRFYQLVGYSRRKLKGIYYREDNCIILYLKICRHQLLILWLQIELNCDALARSQSQ